MLLLVIWKKKDSRVVNKDWQRAKFSREVSKEEQASGNGPRQIYRLG